MPHDSIRGMSIEARVLDLLAGGAPVEDLEALLEKQPLGPDGEPASPDPQPAVLASLQIYRQLLRAQQREASAAMLVDTARELATPDNLPDLLKVVTRRTRHLLGLDFAYIVLFNIERGVLEGQAIDGHTTSLGLGRVYEGSSEFTRAALSKRSVAWTGDYLSDADMAHCEAFDALIRAEGLKALLAAPLQIDTRLSRAAPIGMLYGASRTSRRFTADERSLIGSIGGLAGLAIENAQLLLDANNRIRELSDRLRTAADESAEFRRLDEARDALGEVALGDDVGALAEVAGTWLGGTVRLLGEDGSVLAGPADLTGSEVTELTATAARQAADPGGGALPAGRGTWVAPVMNGYDHLGAIAVTSPAPPEPHLFGAVIRAVAIMLRRVTRDSAEDVGRHEILDDLLTVGAHRGQQLHRRVRELGFEPDDPSVLVVLDPTTEAGSRIGSWAAAYGRRMHGLATVRGGRAVLLLPGTDPGAAARAAVAGLSAAASSPVTAGSAGPLTGLDSLTECYEEAERCLHATSAIGGPGRAASASELGFLGMLLSGTHDVAAFIESAIGPVLASDRERSSDLAKTLHAYYAAGSSPTRAADQLHLHTNTVVRRLNRIKELLGATWQEPEHALNIQLALQLHQVRSALGTPAPAITTTVEDAESA